MQSSIRWHNFTVCVGLIFNCAFVCKLKLKKIYMQNYTQNVYFYESFRKFQNLRNRWWKNIMLLTQSKFSDASLSVIQYCKVTRRCCKTSKIRVMHTAIGCYIFNGCHYIIQCSLLVLSSKKRTNLAQFPALLANVGQVKTASKGWTSTDHVHLHGTAPVLVFDLKLLSAEPDRQMKSKST